MRWAAALHQAIAQTSLAGLMALRMQSDQAAARDQPLGVVLGAAAALGQLLCLALSRIRELEADALALELIDDAAALVGALHKLERHHNMSMATPESSLIGFLRSHPGTRERVGNLLSLAR